MLFLVDGYNVTMRDAATCDLSKEAQRDSLVTRLAAGARRILGTGNVAVVFDARELLGRDSEKVGSVTVVYASDADTEIVRRCAAAREQVVVVTDDMRLRARISQDVSRRIEYRDASTCFAEAGAPQRSRGADAGAAEERDLPADADDVTRELMGLWLPEDD